MLWESKQLGDVLIVGVVSDGGVAAYKGHTPVEPWSLRERNVRQLGFVDGVVFQPTTDPSCILSRLRPDKMTHGDDWERLREGHETLSDYGVEFVLLPYTPHISSTQLREALGR